MGGWIRNTLADVMDAAGCYFLFFSLSSSFPDTIRMRCFRVGVAVGWGAHYSSSSRPLHIPFSSSVLCGGVSFCLLEPAGFCLCNLYIFIFILSALEEMGLE
jgi:hypothetical protein